MPGKDATLISRRRAARAGVTLTLAACVLLPAGGLVSAAAGSHATTVAGTAAVAAPAETRYDRIAVGTLDDIVNGRFAAATAHFDPTTRRLLPPAALAQAWTAYQAAFGSYRSHGRPADVASGALTVVNVPLSMEHRPGEFRVGFHEDGSIAGVWFLRAGVPVSA
ncbi:DUF3887 domain-containing protein [Streptomyces sp. NPDC058279]|uniref:DUF3887 domain-containing protein n=1 Tax=Streptomyces sp. NPDC058279 TaxID=3346418 RepID=UPI0036EFB00B